MDALFSVAVILSGIFLIIFHKKFGMYGAKLHNEFYGYPITDNLIKLNQNISFVVGIIMVITGIMVFNNSLKVLDVKSLMKQSENQKKFVNKLV